VPGTDIDIETDIEICRFSRPCYGGSMAAIEPDPLIAHLLQELRESMPPPEGLDGAWRMAVDAAMTVMQEDDAGNGDGGHVERGYLAATQLVALAFQRVHGMERTREGRVEIANALATIATSAMGPGGGARRAGSPSRRLGEALTALREYYRGA
jgi:hypothetical protein